METKSILHTWVTQLGLRHQGVLLTAIRGCDGAAKHDPSKPIMRAIRCTVLVPFDARELTEPKGFMYFEPHTFNEAIRDFSKNLDEYPLHFVLHVMHALELIGYKMPNNDRHTFLSGYLLLVKKFHLTPESELELDARLTEDRIASGTVAN
jgi:hypothetical protein